MRGTASLDLRSTCVAKHVDLPCVQVLKVLDVFPAEARAGAAGAHW